MNGHSRAKSGRTAALFGVGLIFCAACGGTEEPDPPVPAPTSPPPAAPAEIAADFVDVAAQAGIDFTHANGLTGELYYIEIMGGGVGLFDYDGDGFLDIYFVNGNLLGREPDPKLVNVLYRNDGDGTFTDVTAAAGVGDPSYGQGCCVGDYDGDGDRDLYVTNYGADRLYRNEGNGTFVDVTKASGLGNDGWGQSCAFLDYDGDGRLDLYVQNYLTYSEDENLTAPALLDGKPAADYAGPLNYEGAADLLYRNLGDGTFLDVTVAAGLHDPGGRGMGLACVDFDGDADVDVFVANDGMENYYFSNNGDGTFTERSLASGLAYGLSGNAQSSMGVDVGDFNADGRLDIVCPATPNQSCTVYENAGDFFLDVSVKSGVQSAVRGTTGFSPNLFDADNDGDLDLFLCNGAVALNAEARASSNYRERYGLEDMLLYNDGAGSFSHGDPLPGVHFREAMIGRGSAVGDLDNDGDLDIVINNLNEHAVVLRNDRPPGNWITLLLQPKAGDPDAIGTRVRLTAGGTSQTMVVHGSGSYLSVSDRRPHFGIGKATRIARIEITWPGGEVTTLEDVAPNQFLRVAP